MTIGNLPGYDYAIKHGYSLASYAGNGDAAEYIKDEITLSIYSGGSARLWAIVGLVELNIGPFSFPHPNTEKFFAAIKRVYQLSTA